MKATNAAKALLMASPLVVAVRGRHDNLRHRHLKTTAGVCSVEEVSFEGVFNPGALCVTTSSSYDQFCVANDGTQLVPVHTHVNSMTHQVDNDLDAVKSIMEGVEGCAFANDDCLDPTKITSAWTSSGEKGFNSVATGHVCKNHLPACGSRDKAIPWKTVVNNKDLVPGLNEVRNFTSYNAPSVNGHGMVVFRARSTGKDISGGPASGIFFHDAPKFHQPIISLAARHASVPQPNNLNTTFTEFPAFPRMSMHQVNIATRAMHAPVIRYSVDVGEQELEETRVGNTGIYYSFLKRCDEVPEASEDTCDEVHTGIAKLGAVPQVNHQGFDFTVFQVPGLPNTAFDVFPGAPAISDNGIIAFKGNFENSNVPQTGVFYRKVREEDFDKAIHVVATSETIIPNDALGDCALVTTFGSTSPPSIDNSDMVFVGLDNETDPSCGGIFKAKMNGKDHPELEALVSLNTQVPGEEDEDGNPFTFDKLGEALSFDGKSVAFWGAWNVDESATVVQLCCPVHGNRDRREYCLFNDTGSICDGTVPNECMQKDGVTGCYQEKKVPNNQGIFVVDSIGNVKAVRKTHGDEDFVFWNYSGKPPTTGTGGGHGGHDHRGLNGGEGDTDSAEPPKFRSSASVAISFNSVAYKMRTKANDLVGIYWGDADGGYFPILETGDNCTILDKDGVDADGHPLLVDGMAMERDGYRDKWLAIAAECAAPSSDEPEEEEEEDADWAGIYLAQICK